MTTYMNGVPVPESLTGKEFEYWCEAQDAKRDTVEATHYWKFMCFCTAAGCFGLGLFVSNLFLG